MSVAKEIATGLIVIGLVSIAFLGATHVYLNENEPSGSGVEIVQENSSGPAQENATNQQTASWWDEHDLHAVPGLENASVEDLPTAEEVENILFNWPVFENARISPIIGWDGSFEDVLNILEDFNFEYHFDENGELVIDTPSVCYLKPGESIPQGVYLTSRDNSAYTIWNLTGAQNPLDFSRYLDNLKIQNGIAVFHYPWGSLLPEAKVVVPVQEGLAYYGCDNGEWAHWSGIWYTLNSKPGDINPFYTKDYPLEKIEIHWRLGEGDYVSWLYALDNGEPVMTWLDNGEPAMTWLDNGEPVDW